MLTVGSLFAGIGGFDLGLERAGMRVIWQSEIDPYASAVLRKHWPHVPNHGDIRTIRAGNVERPDVLCGGFPCQPASVAGKRLGREDDRWLWPEYCRVIAEQRPTWVVGENVIGIVSMELDNVLADLEGLGYSTRTFDIPACAVGAPHERRRIWIVAHANDGQRKRADGQVQAGRDTADGCVSEMADAKRPRQQGPRQPFNASDSTPRVTRETIDAFNGSGPEQWRVEPDVGRVANGVPARVDRLRCLGNSIVPQIAEIIGRAIVSAHK